ncbi:MAG: hypothetical protein U0271_45730 [Polyangiaceae bacterium]
MTPSVKAAQGPRRHTVVLSDVHLSQAHPHDESDPLWMRYRQRDCHPDVDFASLVDEMLRRAAGDALEVVWNGDVFDFDAPWVKDGVSSFEEYPLDDRGCAEQVERIIDDHPIWFEAAGRVVAAGHRLLILSGNHDIELYWPGVRAAIRRAIGRHAPDLSTDELEARVRFRAWFHLTEDGIYLEHGSQYDMFNGVRHAMLPVTRKRDWIHPQTGKLAFKRTGSRMGYFNPYHEGTFYMGLFGYLGHYLRFYAFSSRRHIWRVWFWGSFDTALDIWRHRHDEDWSDEARALAHEETGVSLDAIDATHALTVPSAERWMLPILRELWLDRAIWLFILLTTSIVGAVLGGLLAGAITLGLTAAVFITYELVTPKPDIRTYDSGAASRVERLFEIHNARAVCMGHTHRPSGVWRDVAGTPRFTGNSGSWCPAYHDQSCTKPVYVRRPLLYLVSEESGPNESSLRGGLHFWDGKTLTQEARAPDREPAHTVHGHAQDQHSQDQHRAEPTASG